MTPVLHYLINISNKWDIIYDINSVYKLRCLIVKLKWIKTLLFSIFSRLLDNTKVLVLTIKEPILTVM